MEIDSMVTSQKDDDLVAISGPGVAYSYIRFSSPPQGDGDSQKRQRTLADDYAAAHGLRLNPVRFEDLGVSGWTGKHLAGGALGKFLLAVRQKKILAESTLLVEAFDRLSRGKITEQLQLLLEIVRAGIRVVTLINGQVYDKAALDKDPVALYSTLGFMWRGHEESAIKSFRLCKAWKAKREEALRTGKRMTTRAPAWLRASKDGKFVMIPERAKVVGRIFEMYLQQKGKAAIARQLQREKQPIWNKTRSGIKAWNPNYIIRIISNKAVLGDLELGKRDENTGKRVLTSEVVKGYYPKVIEQDVFDRAQLLRQGKLMPPGQAQSRGANLFTGLLFDGHAKGFRMRMQNKGRMSRFPRCGIYLVSDAKRIEQTNTWSYVKFEESFFAFIDQVDWRELISDSEPPGEASTWDVQITSIGGEIKTLAKERDNYVDYVGKAGYSESVEKKLEQVEQSIKSKQQEIEALKQKRAQARAAVEAIKAGRTVEKVVDIGDRATRLRLRNLICGQVEKIELYPHGAPDDWVLHDRVSMGSWPGFKVTFRNRAWRWVFVDPKNPKGLIALADDANEEEIERAIEEAHQDEKTAGATLKTPRRAKVGGIKRKLTANP
jgi:DNA invertase Pin-like site-specific DNA recombinase